MPAVVGRPLDPISFTAPDGSAVTLPDPHAPRAVLVYFLRAATCGGCRRHLRTLVEDHARYTRAGVELVAVVPEGAAEAGALQRDLEVPFRVLAGDGRAHDAVGLEKRVFGSLQQSGTVLVDRAGVVRHLTTANLPVRLDRDGLLAAAGAGR